MPKLIKIGITGSAGKTSVKEYLRLMLEGSFKVYASPKSYNTPMGICKCVSEMPTDTEVFIAEMGARKTGDIAELCRLVQPSYGIIISVLPQHMESFRSLDNVLKAKFELYEHTSVCILCGDNDLIRCEGMLRGAPVSDFVPNFTLRAEDDIVTANGMEFNLIYLGHSYRVKTSLLGRHSINNLLLAAALALKLGVSVENILRVMSEIKPPKHRLELIRSGGVTVIDDSYNSNIVGFACACEALSKMSGRRIIITPGIAEGGRDSRELNIKAGKFAAGGAEIMIFIGANSTYLSQGAVEVGADCDSVVKVKDSKEAAEVLKKYITPTAAVLYENDFPDNL